MTQFFKMDKCQSAESTVVRQLLTLQNFTKDCQCIRSEPPVSLEQKNQINK